MFWLRFLTALAAMTIFSLSASAQPVPKDYYCGPDKILHRTPKGVLEGLPMIHRSCGKPVPVTKASYSLATPAQVMAALDCDFSAAAKATKGNKKADISRAVITGTIKFSLVTKDSKGFSLAVAAIPVFAGGSVAPSLDASNLSQTTSTTEYSISVDPEKLTDCKTSSADNWLISKVVIDPNRVNMEIDKIQTSLEFVVTKQGSAGLKLNIVPVSIGPQLSTSSANTQSLMLVFDFKAKSKAATTAQPTAAQPTVPAPPAATR